MGDRPALTPGQEQVQAGVGAGRSRWAGAGEKRTTKETRIVNNKVVIPMLVCRDATSEIDFCKTAWRRGTGAPTGSRRNCGAGLHVQIKPLTASSDVQAHGKFKSLLAAEILVGVGGSRPARLASIARVAGGCPSSSRRVTSSVPEGIVCLARTRPGAKAQALLRPDAPNVLLRLCICQAISALDSGSALIAITLVHYGTCDQTERSPPFRI